MFGRSNAAGLVVAEIGDEELAEGAAVQADFLLEDACRLIFALRQVEGGGAQAGSGSVWTSARSLGERRRRALLVKPPRQWREARRPNTSCTDVGLSGVPASLSAALMS